MPQGTWLYRISRVPRKAGIALVKSYRLIGSPWVGHSCRFQPTCSAYALEALERYGLLKGGIMSLTRWMRCGPWSKPGYDPVPNLKQGKNVHERTTQ